MYNNFNEVIENGQKFEITYRKEKNIFWAITYVKGEEIKSYGDSMETAYWAIQQNIYQALNFRL